MGGSRSGRGKSLVASADNDIAYASIETTSLSVAITDEHGQVLEVNRSFERLFIVTRSGLPRDPIEDLVIASRYRPAYRAARRAALSETRIPDSGRTGEFIALRADGGEFAVELSVARTSEDSLKVATWIRDLTADQTVVAKTLQRAALLERAEELAGFGSWEWEPETERLRWSDNLFRIYGLAPGDIVPSPEHVIAHCHPDDRERVRQVVAELARTGRSPELRYRHVRPDGTARHLKATVVAVAEASGLSRRMIGMVDDVTEQRQAERELAAHFAVSDALADWEPGVPGALRLVGNLAETLEFEVGMMSVPRKDTLVPWVVWQARMLRAPERESALRELRRRRGEGLSGSAWASGRPTRVADLGDSVAASVRAVDTRTRTHASLALPAVYGQEVLAVITFAARREAVLTNRFMRSLTGLGYEIGHFLARRRGELSAPVLSPRELQVLQLSATGYTRRQIAEQIAVSEATVKTHFEHIYKKLGVPDRASAVGEALRQGFVL